LCDEAAVTEFNFETMRRAMVASQLRTTAVNDPRVLDAMAAVPRERFVPRERQAIAYADMLVPLGRGRWLNSPLALGRLLTEVVTEPDDHALIVGAATGYAAAVLARLVKSVVAVEEDPALLATARAEVTDSNVAFVEGNNNAGWSERAPYDLILIDGAIETVSDAIIAQLSENGRLAAAIIEDGVSRLSIGRRAGHGFGTIAFADTAAAPLPGFERPRAFTF
jgi:protein-L-isoaspartate(D-aspartate) O-methyltransferase